MTTPTAAPRPPGRGGRQLTAGGRRPQQLQQVALAAGAAGPGSPGSPKRQLNSSTLRPVLGEHEAGVEDAPEVDAPAAQFGHRGPHRQCPPAAAYSAVVHGRHRRVGAHAAGVRARVAVQGPLVVLRRGQRQDLLSADDGEEGDLLALQELLDEHRVGRRAEAALHEALGQRRLRLRQLVRHDDALAGGQPVGLHHHRRPVLPQVGQRRIVLGEGGGAGRWGRRPRPSPAWRRPWSLPGGRRRPPARRRRSPAPAAGRPDRPPAAPPAPRR